MAGDSKIYLPKQRVRRGIAGYHGKNVVVVDPSTKRTRTAAEDTEDTKKALVGDKPARNTRGR